MQVLEQRSETGLVDLDPRISLAQYELLYATPGGPPDRFSAASRYSPLRAWIFLPLTSIVTTFYSTTTALNLHISAQLPQAMHLSVTM